jgi:Kef-type K+ transport system membrane component KefB
MELRSKMGSLRYGVMLALSGAALWGILSAGSVLSPSPVAGVQAAARPAAGHGQLLFHVLLALLIVIACSRLLGLLFRRLQQPAVIGEVVAGIVLGPSLLGRVAPDVAAYVFPPSITPQLGVLAQVGVIVFMFLVGLELDTSQLKKSAHSALAISHASIVFPLLLGAGLSLWLYPRMGPSGVSFSVFALFMGVAMSITAFPVLARILTDQKAQRTQLGMLALSCAAVDDVTAWCLLALVVGAAEAHPQRAALTVSLTGLYIAAMFWGAKPKVHAWIRRQELHGRVEQDAVALVLVAVLLSALIAEVIGIHAIFGAFLVGSVIPADSRMASTLKHRLEDLVLVLLLPAFFAFTGLRTQLALVEGASAWATCALIVLVACLGKVGGTYAAARLTGLKSRDALSLGLLMNTRGLVELVVLNFGLDLGVISPSLFAMMVVMALVTTFATTPLVRLLTPETAANGNGAAAHRL